MPRAALLLIAALLAVALPGCSNTCPYGSGGNHSTDCKSRPEPSAKEAAGFTAASLAARLPAIRRQLPTINGLEVNRWGELWVRRPGSLSAGNLVIDVDGREVKEPKDEWESSGTDAFSSQLVRSNALEDALKAIAALDPEHELKLANADLRIFPVGPRAGLRWHIVAYHDRTFRNFEASPAGELLCELDDQGACHPV